MVTITKYVWDTVSDCVLSELDENNAVKAVYTNEPQQYGGVLSQRRGTTSHYHHHDALGSTRFLTDSSGNVTDTYLNDAWGNSVASTGTTVNPFRWVGKYGYYTDDSTGQVYVRARVYQPIVARWTSVDPVLAGLLREQFVYANNAPSFLIDPHGLEAIAENLISLDSGFRATPTVWTMKDPLYELEKWLIKIADHALDDTVIRIPALPRGKCGKKCLDLEAGPCKVTVKPGRFAFLCVPIAKIAEQYINDYKGGFKNACVIRECWFCACENEIPYDNPADATPLTVEFRRLNCDLIATCPKSMHEYGSKGVCAKFTLE